MQECVEEWGNQLASLWMHRGMALMNLHSAEAVLEAVSCFDRAIALRQALPIESNHWFRYALSGSWINRGDALRQSEQHPGHGEALKSYDEALGLLRTLPLDQNPLYCRRLAVAWLHRGVLLEKSRSAQMQFEAVNSFRKAISALEVPNAVSLGDHQALLAGAWANLGGALINFCPEQSNSAASACVAALSYARAGKHTDPALVEAFLKTTDTLCRLIFKSRSNQPALSAELLSVTTDAIEETLQLVTDQGKQMRPDLSELVRRIFRFGCWIYEGYQPHFLAEYINDYLRLRRSEYLEPDLSSLAIARDAVRRALDSILSRGFSFLSTPKRDLVLDTIRTLRLVAEQLQAPIPRNFTEGIS
jgi:tetratricopeptide (TPR) repeat protein